MSDKDKMLRMFEVLICEHSPMLVSYLTAVTASKDDAEDLAQEAFLRAYLHFDSFGSKGSNFGAWLRTIGRNVAVEKFRGQKERCVVDPHIIQGIEAVFNATEGYGKGDSWSERIDPLRACLRALPESLETVCQFYYFEELTAKSIASRLNTSLAVILKRLERTRKALRECITRKLGLQAKEIGETNA